MRHPRSTGIAALAIATSMATLLAVSTIATDTEARLVADVNEGPNGSAWSPVGVAGDRFYFIAGERGERFYPRAFGMWVTDGTRRGTRRIHDPSDSWGDSGPRVDLLGEDAGDLLFAKRAPCAPGVWEACGFAAFNPWRSTGTTKGTEPIVDEAGRLIGIASDIVRLGDDLYFGGYHQERGNALFRLTSGSVVAEVVAAFSPKLAAHWGHPAPLAALGDRLVFLLNDRSHGQELWISDGTAAGTGLLADIVPGKASMLLGDALGDEVTSTVLGDRLLFQAHSSEGQHLGTWVTDGSPAGTMQLTDALLTFGPAADLPSLSVEGRDDGHGREPWHTDGTAAGTALLRDVAPGSADGINGDLTTGAEERQLWGWLTDVGAGPDRYFVGDDGRHGPEPWVTDGSVEGTRMVMDLDPEPGRGSDPSLAMAIGDRLFFTADDGVHGRQLWVTDGEPAGTRQVDALDLAGRAPFGLLAFGDDLLLALHEPEREMSLWRIDGSAAAATRIWQGRARGLDFYELDGAGFFVPWRAAGNTRLWMTDGTRKGTSEVVGPKGRRLRFDGGARTLARLGDRIVFYADDGRRGLELWSLPAPNQ